MTEEMMSLRARLEKSSDADLLREMVGFAAQRLMELEVASLTGAAHGERSPDRINHRNGYRDRIWQTRAGAVELRIPKLPGLAPGRSRRGLTLFAAAVLAVEGPGPPARWPSHFGPGSALALRM
jgi:hypothetical protein